MFFEFIHQGKDTAPLGQHWDICSGQSLSEAFTGLKEAGYHVLRIRVADERIACQAASMRLQERQFRLRAVARRKAAAIIGPSVR